MKITNRLIKFFKNWAINSETIDNRIQLLLNAATSGDTEVVNELIQMDTPLDSKNEMNYTPLMLAAHHGHIEIVKSLIKANVLLEEKGPGGNTALMNAVISEHLEIIRILIEAGASLNAKDINGSNVLVHALFSGNISIINALIANGASIKNDISDTKLGGLLIHAASDNNIEIVKLLIESGARLDYQTSLGYTALHRAIIYKNFESANILISAGAPLSFKCVEGYTPLVHLSSHLVVSVFTTHEDVKNAENTLDTFIAAGSSIHDLQDLKNKLEKAEGEHRNRKAITKINDAISVSSTKQFMPLTYQETETHTSKPFRASTLMDVELITFKVVNVPLKI